MSVLNFTFLWKELSANNMLSTYYDLAKQFVSSTNLFHSFTLSFKFGITDKSHVLKQSIENEPVEVTQKDFKTISSHFKKT